MSVQDFYIFAMNVYTKMTENSDLFPEPPVELSALKADLAQLVSLMGEATYKDSRVIVQRDSLRGQIHVVLRRLAHYVERICSLEQDRTTQLSIAARSGFEVAPATTAPDELLSTRITRVENPRSGVLHLRYAAAGRKARGYQVRTAVKGTPDPDSWPTHAAPNAKDGAVFENLTPGVVYTFQVRVFSSPGFGDWSPAVDKMCT